MSHSPFSSPITTSVYLACTKHLLLLFHSSISSKAATVSARRSTSNETGSAVCSVTCDMVMCESLYRSRDMPWPRLVVVVVVVLLLLHFKREQPVLRRRRRISGDVLVATTTLSISKRETIATVTRATINRAGSGSRRPPRHEGAHLFSRGAPRGIRRFFFAFFVSIV